ncbi:hypothetical protein GCM10009096_28410 [Parasphingorhabdus litoris]|uniref:Uncharacterized protein n=1 Tax=Parasphingorhabdus litoris TaxID=394733 RepID=A0ABN1AUK1_9SPHN
MDEQINDDEILLKFEELNVDILLDTSKTCAITSKVDEKLNFATFTGGISKNLGGSPPNEVIGSDTAYWLIEPEEQNETFAISLMVSAKTDANLATLMISKP